MVLQNGEFHERFWRRVGGHTFGRWHRTHDNWEETCWQLVVNLNSVDLGVDLVLVFTHLPIQPQAFLELPTHLHVPKSTVIDCRLINVVFGMVLKKYIIDARLSTRFTQ